MIQIDKVVQENASDADKSAGAAESLFSLSQDLRSMIDELTTIVGGAGKGGEKKQRRGN